MGETTVRIEQIQAAMDIAYRINSRALRQTGPGCFNARSARRLRAAPEKRRGAISKYAG